MNESKIYWSLQLWELFDTVCQGLSYLTEHHENKQVRKDVCEGLRALQAQDFPEGEAFTAWLMSTERKLSGGVLSPAELLTCIQKGTLLLTEWLSKTLLQEVKDEKYLPRSIAEKLFAFTDRAPHQCTDIYLLIFSLCQKSAVSMPLESYQHMLHMLEEQPAILTGKNNTHPDYVYQASAQRVFDSCPICGGKGTPHYQAFSYDMINFSYPHLPVKLWMQCGACGNLYTYQYPKALLTQAAHPTLIYPDPERKLTAVQMDVIPDILSTWSAILNKLHSYTSGTRLLEVGIGNGSLLAVALEMGYEPDAVEIVRESAQQVADLLELSVWNGDFLSYHPDKTYSVIIMGDVIEHVADPEQALHNAYALLEDDGVLWLSTPNFKSSFSRMMKFQDAMWKEPYHISYFSYDGLRTLAEKCGLCIREYQTSHRYFGSMELILTKAPRTENADRTGAQ